MTVYEKNKKCEDANVSVDAGIKEGTEYFNKFTKKKKQNVVGWGDGRGYIVRENRSFLSS